MVYFGCFRCTPTATITFAGSGSSPPCLYHITWGDGASQNLTNDTGNAVQSHTCLAVIATYTVTLEVVDHANVSSSAPAKVFVKQRH